MPGFRPVCEPSTQELPALVEQIALRVGNTLEQHRLIERDNEKGWLTCDGEAGPADLVARLASQTPPPRTLRIIAIIQERQQFFGGLLQMEHRRSEALTRCGAAYVATSILGCSPPTTERAG